MSDEKALLAEIWEHPHDDTVRLAYSDWLQENGQPDRAEFIRVQCELAHFDEWTDTPRKAELDMREKQLWTKNAKAWKADLPLAHLKTAGFHRGFPHPQPRTMIASKFLKLTADDFAGAPLWNYTFPTNYRLLPKLLACPHLLRLGALNLRFWLETADDVRTVVTSPHVRNVADLNISTSRLGDNGVRALAENASGLPNLRHLDLESSRLKSRGIEALVMSPLANNLRSLRLWGNYLGTEGIFALARSPGLTRLEKLDIADCDLEFTEDGPSISRDAVVALLTSPHLTVLKSLNLDPRDLGAKGVRQMCATRPVFRLRALRFHSYPAIGDEGAEALAEWSALADVRELWLFGNQIGDRGALALARSPYLNKITDLRLDLNQLNLDATAVLHARFGDAVRD